MTEGQFIIRRCRPTESESLAKLGDQLFRQAYAATVPEPQLSLYLEREFSPQQMAIALADERACIWVAEDLLKGFLGYVWLDETLPPPSAKLPGTHSLHLWRIFVDTAWHGRGVAQALVNACVAETKRRAADALWLTVWQEAARPIAFYRKAGFEVVGLATFAVEDHIDQDFIMARPVR